jgi:ankyrin repeat protein
MLRVIKINLCLWHIRIIFLCFFGFNAVVFILQVEVARHICGNLLDNVCLFRGCSDHFKDFLIVSMSTVTYSPDEHIFRLGEVATDMYVVQSGAADELIEDLGTLTGEKPFATARPGHALGALALFFELRHMYSARVSRTAGATCLRLSRERFLQLLKYCPEEEERITENAMQSFQKKFGLGGAGEASKAGSIASTKNDESERGTQQTGPSIVGSASGSAASSLQGVGKQARNSISQIKRRRRALRTHILLSAARSNNLARTEWALQGGHISVNACDDMGRSALHVAASEGHLEMVEFLLCANSDPRLRDRHGNSALNDAVRHSHDAVAAAIRLHAPDVRVMLRCLAAGIQLCSASATGNLAEVERLIVNRVSAQTIDYDSRTALHLAASEGRIEVAKFLISVRADVQAKDRRGNSPLDDAIRHGHRSVQAALLKAGARVGWMRNGLRACRASAAGDEDSVRLVRALVEMGLDPVACDSYDRTPLHLAACSGGLSLLEFLLRLDRHNCETTDMLPSPHSRVDVSKEDEVSKGQLCTVHSPICGFSGGVQEGPERFGGSSEASNSWETDLNMPLKSSHYADCDKQWNQRQGCNEEQCFTKPRELVFRERRLAGLGFINVLDR